MTNSTNSINPFETIFSELREIKAHLSTITRQFTDTNGKPAPDEFFDVNKASEFTNKAKATIYGLASKGLIPFLKQGNRLYFSKKELNEWILSGRKNMISEIEAEAVNSVGPKRVRK